MITRLQTWFTNSFTFFASPISRIFGLTDDQYPATGIQPYNGDRPQEH
jgi:hypothetical protein